MNRFVRLAALVAVAAFTLVATVAHAVTVFPLPSGQYWQLGAGSGITAGPDGNLWISGFGEYVDLGDGSLRTDSNIGRVTPEGVVTVFPLPSGQIWHHGGGIAAGPDGNLWITGVGEYVDLGDGVLRLDPKIGRVTPEGVVTAFPLPPGHRWALHYGGGIAAGPDGNLWITGLTERSDNSGPWNIGRVTPEGVVTVFPLPSGHRWARNYAGGIAAGPDGNLWITGFDDSSRLPNIGRVTPEGVVTVFPLPSGQFFVDEGRSAITAGPDGNLWITGVGEFVDAGDGGFRRDSNIGRVTPEGVVTVFPLPSGHRWWAHHPFNGSGIAAGPEGNLWISGVEDSSGLSTIGRVTPEGVVTVLSPLPSRMSWGDKGSGIAAGPNGGLWISGFGEDVDLGDGATARVSKIGRFTCELGRAVGCVTGEKSSFLLIDNEDDSKDRLAWELNRGGAFDQSVLGDPVTTSEYELCIYDETGGTPSLVASLRVDPNAGWVSKDPKGLRYADKTGGEDGVTAAVLRTGDGGETWVHVSAKGINIPMPAPLGETEFFDQDATVIVQLTNSGSNTCWASEFTTAKKNDSGGFNAKTR